MNDTNKPAKVISYPLLDRYIKEMHELRYETKSFDTNPLSSHIEDFGNTLSRIEAGADVAHQALLHGQRERLAVAMACIEGGMALLKQWVELKGIAVRPSNTELVRSE